jgi:hypothetical protein
MSCFMIVCSLLFVCFNKWENSLIELVPLFHVAGPLVKQTNSVNFFASFQFCNYF